MNSHQAIIKKVNEYSIGGIPFLLIVDFEMEKPLLLQMHEMEKEDVRISFSTSPADALVGVHDPAPLPPRGTSQQRGEIQIFNIIPIKKKIYETGFNQVMKELKYGNSYLTNFTGKTEIETSSTLNEIFEAAVAPYKIKYKDEWVCFSPECFIRIIDGEIFSFPMKGTIDAALPDAKIMLLQDEKEIAEHYTIVDLIRNDLSIIAKNVVVEKFRYIEEIHSNKKNLLQASSKIKGTLADDYRSNLGDLLFTLLPAGSISGAPKKKTIEIINQSEPEPRGYYTGVAFYFDGENVDSCVLIRFIEKENEKYYYRSGGGITVNSEPGKEYQELNDKIYVPVY